MNWYIWMVLCHSSVGSEFNSAKPADRWFPFWIIHKERTRMGTPSMIRACADFHPKNTNLSLFKACMERQSQEKWSKEPILRVSSCYKW